MWRQAHGKGLVQWPGQRHTALRQDCMRVTPAARGIRRSGEVDPRLDRPQLLTNVPGEDGNLEVGHEARRQVDEDNSRHHWHLAYVDSS